MDNLTHSLLGLTLARTSLGRRGRGTTLALLLASNAPDIDIVTTVGGLANYLAWHRGPTHGPLGVIGLAVITAAIVRALTHRSWWPGATSSQGQRAAPATYRDLLFVSVIGVVCHVLLDLPTSYGTRPLSPFSWTWYAYDWFPIVDVYLLAWLASRLWWTRRREAATAWHGARATLVVMVLYYAVRASSHAVAIARANEFFLPPLATPCPSDADLVVGRGWIESWTRRVDNRVGPEGTCLHEVAAVPDFVSPFRWRLIADEGSRYRLTDVNLWRDARATPSSPVLTIANAASPAASRAATAPNASTFLAFSRFPAANIVSSGGATTVRWADMRFVMSTLGDGRPRTGGMFGATVRLDANGAVVDDRLGP